MTTLTAHVPDDFVEEIDSIAVELERPRDWVIQDALREYVSRHRLDVQRWRETQEAIDAAERGEVVPAEEVFAWLDTWGREGIATK
jgi:predicted transcriptional regulator